MREIVLVEFAQVPLKLVPHHPERDESKRGGQQRRSASSRLEHENSPQEREYQAAVHELVELRLFGDRSELDHSCDVQEIVEELQPGLGNCGG